MVLTLLAKPTATNYFNSLCISATYNLYGHIRLVFLDVRVWLEQALDYARVAKGCQHTLRLPALAELDDNDDCISTDS
jgi:hypothetical protein